MAELTSTNEDHFNTFDTQGKMDIHFSCHHGENIELSEEKYKASWKHRFSGGIAFSAQPVKNNTKLKLDLAGTGHAFIGMMTRDPSLIKNMRQTLAQDVTVAKEMKVHKRLGAVNVTTHSKDKRKYVHFECGGDVKVLDVTDDTNVWLFLYMKFGDLIAVLHSDIVESRSFHHVTGCNIHCLDQERRSIKLQVENPSAICCLNQRLRPGHSLKIQTNAIRENGNMPSRSHIKIGIIDLDPSELKSRDPESFVIDCKAVLPSRWTIVEKLSTENVVGEMKLYMTNNGRLYFCHSSGVEGTHVCRLRDLTSGVTVILDLFRTECVIVDSHDEGTYESVDKDYDYVKPESDIIGEVKMRLKVSDKRREKERQPSSDGGYLQMIDAPPPGSKDENTVTKSKCSPRVKRCGMYRKNASPTNAQMCS